MSFTYADAEKVTTAPLLSGVMKAIATSDMLISRVAFRTIQGSNSWTFNREKAIPSPAFVGRNASSVGEGTATFDQVPVAFRHIVHDMDLMNATQGQGLNSKGIQLSKALKGLGRTIGNTMINGGYATGFSFTSATLPAGWAGPLIDSAVIGPYQDTVSSGPASVRYTNGTTSLAYRAPGEARYGAEVDISGGDGPYTLYGDNPSRYITVTIDASDHAGVDGERQLSFTSSSNEFDGLRKQIPTSQVIPGSVATNGTDVDFPLLNAMLYEYIKVRENLAFVGSAKVVNKIRTLLLSVGGTTPMVPMQGFGMVPEFEGVPVLTSDFITNDETIGSTTDASSLYLVSFDPNEGFYGAVQSANMTESADTDPYASRIMGVQLYAMGQVEGKPADRTRVEWLGAAGLGSELAAVRASGLKTA